MVDQANLDAINMLNGELRQISTALDIFDHHGGRIVNFTVASGLDLMPAMQITLQTATMAYPPQMVDAIKNYLADREQNIRDELSGLGITGVSESPR